MEKVNTFQNATAIYLRTFNVDGQIAIKVGSTNVQAKNIFEANALFSCSKKANNNHRQKDYTRRLYIIRKEIEKKNLPYSEVSSPEELFFHDYGCFYLALLVENYIFLKFKNRKAGWEFRYGSQCFIASKKEIIKAIKEIELFLGI